MICFKMYYIENNCDNICHSPSGEEEEASDAEEVKDQETQVPQEAQQEMPQEAMDTEDKDASAGAEVRPAEAAAPSTSGACATVAEPKAVSEVKKRAAALDSTSDSGHASDGTDHGHADGNNAAANGANKNRRDDAISTRGDGLERVAYKIGDLGHVAPVTSSGANPEVSYTT